MNKSLTFLIYSGIWLLLVLVQTFITSAMGDTPSVLMSPELYYSTWILDVYLIMLFYLNYYLIVPKMIRRRLFLPYFGVVVLASLVGFLLPIVLYVAWQWTMPGTPVGIAPLSSVGVLGAVAAMSIGLAIRSVLEWVRLEKKLVEIEALHRTDRFEKVAVSRSSASEPEQVLREHEPELMPSVKLEPMDEL
ncbi:MAG: hypothetical protein Q4A61_00560 [Porphyromonadaceae bacterium]|nr:hypothetical protein [Porphyromonadaceae bacterium]